MAGYYLENKSTQALTTTTCCEKHAAAHDSNNASQIAKAPTGNTTINSSNMLDVCG
jgi:hypothetical protein